MVYKFLTRSSEWIAHRCQSRCLLCQHMLRQPHRYFGLCHCCEQALPHLQQACERCALPLTSTQPLCGECQKQAPLFDHCECAVTYQGYIPALIHQLKVRHHGPSCRLLSDLLSHRLSQSALTQVDLVIASPMFWRKNLQRENNHSHLLAKRVCHQLALPYHPQIIQQYKPTANQKGLTARQRRQNLRGAFRTTQEVNGCHIAIIDDVITTGSTMNEIARTLKLAGATTVTAWAIARTPKPGDG